MLTLDPAKVKAFTAGMGVDDTFVDTYIAVAEERIENYVGASAVAAMTTIPATINLAAAMFIKMHLELTQRDSGAQVESVGGSSTTYTVEASGLTKDIEGLLNQYKRFVPFNITGASEE